MIRKFRNLQKNFKLEYIMKFIKKFIEILQILGKY